MVLYTAIILPLFGFATGEVVGVAVADDEYLSVAQHFLYLGLGVGLTELRGGILLEDFLKRYVLGYRDGARVVAAL